MKKAIWTLTVLVTCSKLTELQKLYNFNNELLTHVPIKVIMPIEHKIELRLK